MNAPSNARRRQIAVLIKIIAGVLFIAGFAVTIRQILRPVRIEWELRERPIRSIVWAVALDPDDVDVIYAGTDGGGVYKSTDGGATWASKNDGLKSLQRQQTGIESALYIRDILISRTQPGVIYAATFGPEGIYRSDDGGETWIPELVNVPDVCDKVDEALAGDSVHVRVLAETETDIFAGTLGGVFLLDPDLGCWQPTDLKGKGMSIRALLVHPDRTQTLYAATLGQGIYLTQDGGQTWQPKNKGLENEAARKVNALILDPANPNVMYAGTQGDGVYRSSDGGENWEPWNEGLLQEGDVWSLQFTKDGILFVGLRRGGTYKQVEHGQWQRANFPYGALTLETDPRTGAIYVGTWGRGLYRNEKGRDESSQDWQTLALPEDYLHLRAVVYAFPTLYVGTNNDGVYASQDGGKSWDRRSEGLKGESLSIWSLAVSHAGRKLYAGTGDGVFVSDDSGEHWESLGKPSSPPPPPHPPDDFSVISLTIGENRQGQDVIYAGTRQGLWILNSSQEMWDGPKEFKYRTGTRTEVLVESLLVDDGTAYASVWGAGVYKSVPVGPWSPVQMTSRYVEALMLADKTWLQWGGKQFYALTEQGLYGSSNGTEWNSLPLGSIAALTTDPLHPQVAYASLLTIKQDSTSAITSTSTITSEIMASMNDGLTWRGVNPISGRVTHLVRNPSDPHEIVALVADGELYWGQVHLPWLVREAVVVWLAGCAFLLVFVLAPYSYFNLLHVYGLSHRLAWGLLAHPGLLFRIQNQRFQNHLRPLEKLILATADQLDFRLVVVWAKLDEIGISTSRARLTRALDGLVRHGLLKEQAGTFRYATLGLQAVAAVEFQESEDALIEEERRESRLLKDIERFFQATGFDVRQDAPHHLTEFVLRPHRVLYRGYRQLYAWLRSQGPLQGTEVDVIRQEAIRKHSVPPDAVPNGRLIPIAFAIVTEIPQVEAFRRIRAWQEQGRLIPLSTMTIRSALRERSAIRDLDMMVQRERRQVDLYDIRAPVIDQLNFFGRQDMIGKLKENLQASRRVDVWSLPAMGKTSLLWLLKETLINPVVAYADLTYGWQGETLLHQQIIADLASDLWLKYDRFFDERSGNFEEQLLSVAQAVPARGKHEVRVVLLLDGLSTMANGRERLRAFERLCDLTDAHQDLAMVVAWQDPVLTGATWEPLATLDETESQQLLATIGAQMGLDFTQDSIERIYRETGGHPLLLRQLGSAIARQVSPRLPTEFTSITVQWVDQVIPHYRPIRDRYFENVWLWCSPDQKESLRAWITMSNEEKEQLLNANLYLRTWIQTCKALGDLFTAWILATTKESHL